MSGATIPPQPSPAPPLATGTVPTLPRPFVDGVMPSPRRDQGLRTTVREPADGSPPVCVAPYDAAITRLPERPAGITVSGGVTDLRVDLDELEDLAVTMRTLTRRLDDAGVQRALAATDVRGLEERITSALDAATALTATSGMLFEMVTSRHALASRVDEVASTLDELARATARAADEAGRLVDGLDGARRTYAEAEEAARPDEGGGWRRLLMMNPLVAVASSSMRARKVVEDVARNGHERTDLATPALEILTDLRTPFYLLETSVGARLGRAPRSLTRAGTADLLTEVAHYAVSEPLTFLWTGRFRAGLPTPEMTRHAAPAGAGRASTATQALRTLDSINAHSDEGAVGVQRTVRADGSSSWVVYIPGSEGKPDPRTKGFVFADHARTWAGNTGVLMRRHEQAIRAVERAMDRAGVRDGEKVVFVGHSQGGAIGALLAAKRGAGGLVTVGSPTGAIDLPPEVEAVHVEVEGDEVHELDGRENPATLTRTTVKMWPDGTDGTPHAPVDTMHSSVNGVRAAEALEGSAVTAAIDGVLADVGGRPSGPLEESLASPVEVYVPEPQR